MKRDGELVHVSASDAARRQLRLRGATLVSAGKSVKQYSFKRISIPAAGLIIWGLFVQNCNLILYIAEKKNPRGMSAQVFEHRSTSSNFI